MILKEKFNGLDEDHNHTINNVSLEFTMEWKSVKRGRNLVRFLECVIPDLLFFGALCFFSQPAKGSY